jgi:outer membrane protein assembly factor BamB/protein-L-isoaspartate O-methyltransferase
VNPLRMKNSYMLKNKFRRSEVRALLALFLLLLPARAEDWPMLGRDQSRNPVSPEKCAPTDWDFKTGRNIKWKAKLGYITFGSPVVAGGLVWIGTNNDGEGEPPVEKPGGRLMCFRESDGQLLYQFPMAPSKASVARWAVAGVTASPLIERDRLWLTTLEPEVVCLDVAPLRRGEAKPTELWKLDMETSLGVMRRYGLMGGPQMCSIGASYGDLIYVITGNGRRISWDNNNVFHDDPPKPATPALLCLDKNNGKIIWQDKSPGTNEIMGEWSSPLVAMVDGQAQVIAPQGDGWLRSFDANTGELLWKFDINPKDPKTRERNFFVPPPVYYNGKIYISSGGYIENGEGPGKLVCLDPRKRGDISLQLEHGEPNPNSGALWHLDDFGRAMGTIAIQNDLLIAAGFNGFVYCLEPNTGKEYWRHDLRAHTVAAPLIVDNLVYLVDEDGEVDILELAKTKKFIKQISVEGPLYASPIYANGVLYLASNEFLYAVKGNTVVPSKKSDAATADQSQNHVALSDDALRPAEPTTRALRVGRDRAPDALFVPTPHDVVARMLELAGVKKDTVLIDLGSGDGRILIAAAEKYGSQAIGYEIDKKLVELSREAVRTKNLEALVRIEHEDIFTQDLSRADVITAFLYPRLMERLIPQLQKLKPGSRIVSHQFEIPGATPDQVIVMDSAETGEKHRILLWAVPLKLTESGPK